MTANYLLAVYHWRQNKEAVQTAIRKIAEEHDTDEFGLLDDGLFSIIDSPGYHASIEENGNELDEVMFLNAICVATLADDPRFTRLVNRLMDIMVNG